MYRKSLSLFSVFSRMALTVKELILHAVRVAYCSGTQREASQTAAAHKAPAPARSGRTGEAYSVSDALRACVAPEPGAHDIHRPVRAGRALGERRASRAAGRRAPKGRAHTQGRAGSDDVAVGGFMCVAVGLARRGWHRNRTPFVGESGTASRASCQCHQKIVRFDTDRHSDRNPAHPVTPHSPTVAL